MNKLKRTLALVATLAISATAFVGVVIAAHLHHHLLQKKAAAVNHHQILNLLLKVKAQLLNRANLHIQVHFQQAATR